MEIVLTAHPTQIVRRSLQYKLAKIAALLDQNDRQTISFAKGTRLTVCFRPDLTHSAKESVVADLVREVTAVWQTQEFRARKPTPIDGDTPTCHPIHKLLAEARGGLNIVEQSLWGAVPSYVRRLSSALKKATGRCLRS